MQQASESSVCGAGGSGVFLLVDILSVSVRAESHAPTPSSLSSVNSWVFSSQVITNSLLQWIEKTLEMTIEMATRITKVKEEIEESKPDFHHPQKLHDPDLADHKNLKIKEEAGIIDHTCQGCGQFIYDEYLLKVGNINPCMYCVSTDIVQVGDKSWHNHCLRCSCCHTPLYSPPPSTSSCYLKYDQVLCKVDYLRLYGHKCSKCYHPITASDWIRKPKNSNLVSDFMWLLTSFNISPLPGVSSCLLCLWLLSETTFYWRKIWSHGW